MKPPTTPLCILWMPITSHIGSVCHPTAIDSDLCFLRCSFPSYIITGMEYGAELRPGNKFPLLDSQLCRTHAVQAFQHSPKVPAPLKWMAILLAYRHTRHCSPHLKIRPKSRHRQALTHQNKAGVSGLLAHDEWHNSHEGRRFY